MAVGCNHQYALVILDWKPQVKNNTKPRLAPITLARACLLFASSFCGSSFAQEGGHTYSSQAIETGLRVYVQQCMLCHGPDGSLVAPINLSRGIFRNVTSDDDLRQAIAEGAAEGRMPAFNMPESDLDGLVAYIRTGFDPERSTVRIGSKESGLVLFGGKAECDQCHRVRGVGPRTAPDLSEIGLLHTPAALHRAMVDPAAALLPINRPVTLITRAEETITGRRLNEDTYTVQLIDSNEQLRSLVKADLVSYEISDTPTHEPTRLSQSEVADVIAYLLSLRGDL